METADRRCKLRGDDDDDDDMAAACTPPRRDGRVMSVGFPGAVLR